MKFAEDYRKRRDALDEAIENGYLSPREAKRQEENLATFQGYPEDANLARLARARERRRRSVMGKIIRAGRPAPSIRTLPTTSPLPPRGFEHVGGWVDEAWRIFEQMPRQRDRLTPEQRAELDGLTTQVREQVDARLAAAGAIVPGEPLIGVDPAGGEPLVFERDGRGIPRLLVGDRKPFDFKAAVERFTDQFPEHDVVNQTIRDLIREQDRKMLAAWTEMRALLPDPPEGKAWFPVIETEEPTTPDWGNLSSNDHRIVVTQRLRAELREA